MKKLSTMVNNLDLTRQDNHSLQNKIPPVVKTIVDDLFEQLAFVFPAWKYTWDTPEKIKGVKKEWVKSFFENDIRTKEQIGCGLKKARKADSDFLPSCGKFVSWCKPSPEDLGYPSEQKALRQCVNHRNKEKMNIESYASDFIITLCERVDWWQMNTATNQQQNKKAEAAFSVEYLNLIENYIKPIESSSERLETKKTVRDRMTKEQLEDGRKRGLEHLKGVREKLSRTKVGKSRG